MKTTRLKMATGFFCLCAGILAAGNLFAGTGFNVSSNYSIGLAIPDNNPSGLAVTESFSGLGISQITDLQVTLNITGGANGDYMAYLTHGSGYVVLLNRVGKDSGNTFGYGDAGMNVTLSDSAPSGDIHQYQLTLNPAGGQLTGTWAPDGRTDDPATVTTASPRTATLSSFAGLNPDGNWTLFITDVDPGGVGTLQSVSFSVSGVPEPSSVVLLAVGGIAFVVSRRRAFRN